MSKTVLYVDDDHQLRKYIPGLFETHGLTVVTAADGLDALEKVAAGQRFDVLVTDLQMPRMGGDGLVRALRARGCTQPMLVVTGRGGVIAIDGATAVIKKPFTYTEITSAIDAALAAT